MDFFKRPIASRNECVVEYYSIIVCLSLPNEFIFSKAYNKLFGHAAYYAYLSPQWLVGPGSGSTETAVLSDNRQ